MAKNKHENVVYGVLTVAVPFTDLADIAKAEATIRGLTLPGVRVVSVDTRLGKMPCAPAAPDMPAIPAGLRR